MLDSGGRAGGRAGGRFGWMGWWVGAAPETMHKRQTPNPPNPPNLQLPTCPSLPPPSRPLQGFVGSFPTHAQDRITPLTPKPPLSTLQTIKPYPSPPRVRAPPGFVGISTHMVRHEPMRSPPPFDEFRLLEESWALMRHVVEQQAEVVKSHAEVRVAGVAAGQAPLSPPLLLTPFCFFAQPILHSLPAPPTHAMASGARDSAKATN